MSRILACMTLTIIFSASSAVTATAHVTLEQKTAAVGAPYKAVFRVPHGCNGSATVRLQVDIPEGVIGVKPMVKPGWEITTIRGPYEKAHAYFHGAMFAEGIKKVTWSGGRLPNAFYDEFVLSAFIAADLSPGRTLYFPMVQECEKGSNHWTEIPSAAHPKVNDPAPGVTLVPKEKD